MKQAPNKTDEPLNGNITKNIIGKAIKIITHTMLKKTLKIFALKEYTECPNALKSPNPFIVILGIVNSDIDKNNNSNNNESIANIRQSIWFVVTKRLVNNTILKFILYSYGKFS